MKQKWIFVLLFIVAFSGWGLTLFLFFFHQDAAPLLPTEPTSTTQLQEQATLAPPIPSEEQTADTPEVQTEAETADKTRGLRRSTRRGGGGELKYEKRHAFVVGINNYQKSPVFSDLDGPNFDAAEVAAVMSSRFGFEYVTLLVDKKPGFPVPEKVKVVEKEVSKELLKEQLKALSDSSRDSPVGEGDALFFFYAGHGMPGYIVPADGAPDRPDTWLALMDVVKKLHRCNALHTLLVLDCCFSGSILENSEAHDIVKDLEKTRGGISGGDNLRRVFNQRSFQVITAGTGSEVVADQVSKKYAKYISIAKEHANLKKGIQGHSPFTAVFLQGIQGLTGLPDGTQLATDLGYYMNRTLVTDKRIGARQAPKHGRLGKGDGVFMLFPAYKVLNPKLVSPLYLEGDQYAELRGSACYALQQFITGEQLLFPIELDLQPDLENDGKLISERLRKKFKEQGVVLSEGATISVEKKDSLWLITDNENKRVYAVRKEEGQLGIYEKQREEDLVPLTRSAIPHLARLLADEQEGPQLAAAKVLADLALLFSTKFLFSIDLALQSDLDNGDISDDLRQQFQVNGSLLSTSAAVSIEEGGSRWLIIDKDNKQEYIVRKEGEKLKIYVEVDEYVKIDEFRTVVDPLAKILKAPNKGSEIKDEVARGLGRLALYANETAVNNMRDYMNQLENAWRGKVQQPFFPKKVEAVLAGIEDAKVEIAEIQKNTEYAKLRKAEKYVQTMRVLDNMREKFKWLNTEGLNAIKEHEAERTRAFELISRGNLAGRDNRWQEAKTYYVKAREIFKQLGVSTFFADVGLWNFYRNSPQLIQELPGKLVDMRTRLSNSGTLRRERKKTYTSILRECVMLFLVQMGICLPLLLVTKSSSVILTAVKLGH